jgi:hypothetical protein
MSVVIPDICSNASHCRLFLKFIMAQLPGLGRILYAGVLQFPALVQRHQALFSLVALCFSVTCFDLI